ncbi:hydroxyquinol 1,2-dioxygenase [Nocardioides daejeonensis]|uniref:hydroxyquinol 1,2-dioxygenase n=1 Tax=Nocardioides daejeonensis TaxID=1046556 RepID=UPI000D74B941|nr:hydroxyquinol 1,2-dioxygenase [Nocardioides daejeonensis]
MTTTRKAQGGAVQRANYTTVFGSLADHQKGGVELIADDARHYAFSNIFDVASKAIAWDRVAVAKNWEYVLETIRAEGTSPWYAAAHDEFAICMDDGDAEVLVELVKPDSPVAPEGSEGAVLLHTEPVGRPMGRIHLKRGHQALLPKGAAYRFVKQGAAGVLLIQTIGGALTQYRWADICQTV